MEDKRGNTRESEREAEIELQGNVEKEKEEGRVG